MKQSKGFFCIGITGGAGSGKSTVVELIKGLVPTEFLHCDAIAHELMEPGGASYEALLAAFGDGILEEFKEQHGSLTTSEASHGGLMEGAGHLGKRRIAREKLSELAMAAPESRARLNGLTHPLVRRELEGRLTALQEAGFCGVAVIEAALLLEAGLSDLCDEVWYVHAPMADRVRRMKENRGYSEKKIRNILEGQLSEEEFRARTDVTLENPDAVGEFSLAGMESQIKERLETMFDL